MVCLTFGRTHARASPPASVSHLPAGLPRAVSPIAVGAYMYAHVAQSVEHLHGKEKVIGSIPIVGSTRFALSPPLGERRIPNVIRYMTRSS